VNVTDSLYNRYRPSRYTEVLGQHAAVRGLQAAIGDGSHAFLLAGPAGTGKTSLARIAARELSAHLLEVPAAFFTGVDDMRRLLDGMSYAPFGGLPNKAFLLDEAHRLSANAWDSLLKAVEEPPAHVYWLFCTTLPDKVPKTIQTRCSVIRLKPVASKVIEALLDKVCRNEGYHANGEVLRYVAAEALGSPRQALSMLPLVQDARDRQEAMAALRGAGDDDPPLQLCRFLLKGGSWRAAMAIVRDVEDAESCRLAICGYFTKVALSGDGSTRALAVLQAFDRPYSPHEGLAPLLLSLGELLQP
jgi:replication-associated recombination protein RarA